MQPLIKEGNGIPWAEKGEVDLPRAKDPAKSVVSAETVVSQDDSIFRRAGFRDLLFPPTILREDG